MPSLEIKLSYPLTLCCAGDVFGLDGWIGCVIGLDGYIGCVIDQKNSTS